MEAELGFSNAHVVLIIDIKGAGAPESIFQLVWFFRQAVDAKLEGKSAWDVRAAGFFSRFVGLSDSAARHQDDQGKRGKFLCHAGVLLKISPKNSLFVGRGKPFCFVE